MSTAQTSQTRTAPFDTQRLDALMDANGIDVLLATSKHNVQYLLGGHRAFFFDYMDAFGTSRYLPVLIYPKGAPEKAAYVGHGMEGYQHQVKPLWIAEMIKGATSIDSMEKALAYVKKIGVKAARVGVEFPFLPLDAANALKKRHAEQRNRGCAVYARAAARAQDSRRIEAPQDRVGKSHRIHEGGYRESWPRHHQAGTRRRAQARGSQSRTDIRILPRRMRHQPQPRAVRTAVGSRATCCRSIPAATTTAISAISRAWRSLANRMPSLRICLERSKRSSASRCKVIKPGVLGGEIYTVAEERLKKYQDPQSHRFPRARHGSRHARGAAAHRHRPGAIRRL